MLHLLKDTCFSLQLMFHTLFYLTKKVCAHVIKVCIHVIKVCTHVIKVCTHVIKVCAHVIKVCAHVIKVCDHVIFLYFFNTIFVSSCMFPENPEGTQVIVGSMNMGYDIIIIIIIIDLISPLLQMSKGNTIYRFIRNISDTARNPTHNLFRPKCAPIPLGHSDGKYQSMHTFY